MSDKKRTILDFENANPKWKCYLPCEYDKFFQIVPIDDERMHVIVGTTCLCDPAVRPESGEMIVVHNSWDCREVVERLIASEIAALNHSQSPKSA